MFLRALPPLVGVNINKMYDHKKRLLCALKNSFVVITSSTIKLKFGGNKKEKKRNSFQFNKSIALNMKLKFCAVVN